MATNNVSQSWQLFKDIDYIVRSGEIVNSLANELKWKRQEFVQIYCFEFQILKYAAPYLPVMKLYYLKKLISNLAM